MCRLLIPRKPAAALLGIELLWSPVVEDEKIDASKRTQELGVATIATGEREGCEQPRHDCIIGLADRTSTSV
jgi:hypothetical protein